MDFKDSTDLTDGGTVGIQKIFPADVHEGQKRYLYLAIRKEFAEGLMDAIEKCRHPAVVEISESTTNVDHYGRPCIQIEIKARITPVRYHNVEMVRSSNYSISAYGSSKLNLRQRLSILFRGKV